MDLIAVIEHSPPLFYMLVAIISLLVGSFLNVVIYRLPIMMEREWRSECSAFLQISEPDAIPEPYNLVLPRSACPHCHHKITAFENIPVISYLLLGGKCKGCASRISLRYPLVEIMTSILSVIVAIHLGATIQTLFAILFTWSLIVLTLIDYDHQLLPDNITLPFLWLGIICNIFGIFTDINSSVLGAIFGYLVLWTVYITFKLVTGKEGMGHGDFKLLAMLGAWLGWQYLPLIIIISSMLGAVIGIGLIIFKAHEKSQPIPFGPYLAFAGWIALLYGNHLIALYYNWAIN